MSSTFYSHFICDTLGFKYELLVRCVLFWQNFCSVNISVRFFRAHLEMRVSGFSNAICILAVYIVRQSDTGNVGTKGTTYQQHDWNSVNHYSSWKCNIWKSRKLLIISANAPWFISISKIDKYSCIVAEYDASSFSKKKNLSLWKIPSFHYSEKNESACCFYISFCCAIK